MTDLLRKNKYELLDFEPFTDYIAFLETQGYEFVSESASNGWVEYIAQCEDHELKILSIKDQEKEWITVYKTRNELERFEQVEFMLFNENYMKNYGKKKYNRIIKYSAHFEDEEFTRMVTSNFSYKDNIFLNGWRELRKFEVQDLDKVMYCKDMNLTELTMMADKKISEFYEVISLRGDEVKELKLEY
ncbi:MAG: hypothetical protein K2L98_04265 [Bacilli bacterium]|nr:hypothetical protein [Bacilli bacterium]